MAGYCATTDLLYGNIPLPTGITAQKFVDDAAEEIDSYIGMTYLTPVDINASELARPVKLLLKRINSHLATGRLILAVTANGEDDRLHAYGASLVTESLATLQAISDGEVTLIGAAPANADDVAVTGPMIANVDAESNVEAFYGRIANPWYAYPSYDTRNAGGMVL